MEPEIPPSSSVPTQGPPQGLIGPPPGMAVPPPGLFAFPPGFVPPMHGMPPPGMMPPNFAMSMPPPGHGRLPHGMPPGFGPRFPDNMPLRPNFDPSAHNEIPALLETPTDSKRQAEPRGDMGPNHSGSRWNEPSDRFPGPRGPRGFMRPPFEDRQPWIQDRPRFPAENQNRNLLPERNAEPTREPEKAGPIEEKPVEAELPMEGLPSKGKSAESSLDGKAEQSATKKEEDDSSVDNSERQFDSRRDRDRNDRGRGRDRSSNWDNPRERNRDRAERGGARGIFSIALKVLLLLLCFRI